MSDKQIEELGATFAVFTKANEAALAALADGNKARHAEISEAQKKMNERMDQIETIVSRPAVAPPQKGEPEDKIEREHLSAHRKAFNTLIRQGRDFLSPEDQKALRTYVKTDLVTGAKSIATDNLTTGGYLLPRNVSAQVLELLVESSPLRQLADVVSITEGDSFEQPKEGTTAFATGWQGERESPAETAAGTFEMDIIPAHFQYAKPLVTQKQIDDTGFNIEAYVAKKVAERFGLAEGTAFISGSGIGRPLGITSTLPGTTTIETVDSGVSASLDADSFFLLMAKLPEMYAKTASLLMRRATKYLVRRLKGGDGHYLWQPSLQVGQPPSFDGYAVYEAPDVAAVAASAKAVLFGDFKRAYKIVDRQGIMVKPDPFTSKPHVEMYTTRRVGGQCVLPEAVKIMTCGA